MLTMGAVISGSVALAVLHAKKFTHRTWIYVTSKNMATMLQVLFIGLVLIPVGKVTLNFPASPMMAHVASPLFLHYVT